MATLIMPMSASTAQFGSTAQKTKHHGVKYVETATAIAVSAFNDGASSFMAILRQMDIKPGEFCRTYCEEGTAEIKNAQRQVHLASKEQRQARRRKRLAAD